ncbi:hypothetical protein GLOTRDRAFT_41388 [Gloeophyllum trabeum ATCC 11539]|uniref:DUF6532 domain-containing protein n=1 Tax=Gloeophyllum trabeum (strain ATCC 11539 / FP-39264 / Madison 617) TaxID=670483 RepID=S7RRR9_GLOTA|nr:uncharacterized protein GLOTRDRAFT_41388 [Gloeophyllum trabeum ATCC 11539]EPQ55684.1 hypothetical protein GLOTRDRAFT_41388 [Gloeophyllum trabeum ATCC 11539]
MLPEPIPSPPPSPSPRRIVRRCHDCPSMATLETARLTKVRRTRGARSRGRFHVKDFKSVVRSLLLEAIGHYRTRVSTEYAYPTNTKEERWAIEAWSRACHDIGTDLPMEDEFVSMITARASHVRGELKTKACILVEKAYGLTAPSNQDERLANRNKVRDLLTRLGYAYADPTAQLGIYEYKVIQCLVNVTWFADPKDEGVLTLFVFMAVLILCSPQIQNVLDEWQTGEREDIAFSKKHYKAKYDRHLEELERFHEKTQRYGILRTIQTDLLEHARKNARAPHPDSVDLGPGLAEDDIDYAIQDWLARRGGRDRDGEGEGGEALDEDITRVGGFVDGPQPGGDDQ